MYIYHFYAYLITTKSTESRKMNSCFDFQIYVSKSMLHELEVF